MNDMPSMNDKLEAIFNLAVAELGVKEISGKPRGLRNNNPGNIEDGPFAQSQKGWTGTDGRFAKYDTLDHGIDALAALLGKYVIHGVNSVQGVIRRWAPPTAENPNDEAYVKHVCDECGFAPTQIINLVDPLIRHKLAIAMGEFENGRPYDQWTLDDNPDIMEFYREAGHPEVQHDEVPWCAAFVGAILKRSGYKPSGSLLARSYLNWGVGTKSPVRGCVVVFDRGEGLGHVAFFDRWDGAGALLRVIGGNQGDEVCFKDFPLSRVLGYRVPG